MIACILLGLASPALGQAEVPEQGLKSSHTSARVDLSGIGILRGDVNSVRFAPYIDYISRHYAPDVLLYFDRAGHPTECEPVGGDAPAGFVDFLCTELMTNARLVLPEGYDLAGQRGFLPVNVNGALPKVDPVLPVTLLPAGQGHPVTVTTASTPTGAVGPCSVWDVQSDTAISVNTAGSVCTAVLRSKDATEEACVAEGGPSRGGQSWRCWIETRPVPAGTLPEVSLRVRAIAPAETPAYPPFDIPEGQMLEPGAATLQLPISQDDYPLFALRYGWEGPTEILLGVADGNPRVVSCRPIRSSGYPVLDNTACAVALRRGHVAFSPGNEGSGIKYLRRSILWKMP